MSRAELMAYDNAISQYMTKKNLMTSIRREVDDNHNFISQVGQQARQIQLNAASDEI